MNKLSELLAWCKAHPSTDAIDARLHYRVGWITRIARGESITQHGWIIVLAGGLQGSEHDSERRVVALACGSRSLLLWNRGREEHVDAGIPTALRIGAETAPPIGFVPIDPWPQDITFLRGDTLLKDAIVRIST